jgi:hypothetical protein
MTEILKGSCHCGAIKFSYIGEAITRGLRCNCSLCSRKGAMMSSEIIAPENLTIKAKDGALGLYQFGIKTARHFFCKECGIYPFHETARKPGHFRVNLGCVEGIDTFALEYDVFDGKHLL